ncbi:MAG: nucleotide exchange factor GrpE [Oliverpabstia sp.]|nr:nucleotide exchange factor GrpE [Lachnospiraceae bacterium]MDY5025998.1 nucleotide exchange factor GrpE [Oliverpabstia sp.]
MTEENKKPSEEMTEDVNTAAAQEETSADEETPENKEQASESTSESSECDEKEVKTEEKADSSEETKEKKFFGKKKEKKDKKDEKIEELTDQVKRQMAEFDNYRKRTEKEKASMYIIGAKDIVEKILPIVDNFERGLATAEGSEDPFVQGMEKIYKQFLTTLDEMGVKPIEAVGTEFNPDFHNAVMHVEDEEAGENIVVEEFQKGYMYKDFVVRHSMVKVAN